MELLKLGTKVKTNIGDITGIITAASMRGLNVIYEVSYFNNGDHKIAWLNDFEFTVDAAIDKIKVGFI